MSGKANKRARKAAAHFAPRFDKAFDSQVPPKWRVPIWRRVVGIFAHSIVTGWISRKDEAWREAIVRGNERYKRQSLKTLMHLARTMARRKPNA